MVLYILAFYVMFYLVYVFKSIGFDVQNEFCICKNAIPDKLTHGEPPYMLDTVLSQIRRQRQRRINNHAQGHTVMDVKG